MEIGQLKLSPEDMVYFTKLFEDYIKTIIEKGYSYSEALGIARQPMILTFIAHSVPKDQFLKVVGCEYDLYDEQWENYWKKNHV